MPWTESYPFRRIFVDHMIDGVSRVTWQLQSNFNDPGPRQFQLQASASGLEDSTDWENVGAAGVDNWFADDDKRRLRGKRLHTYYRLKLVTGLKTYVSNAVGVYGILPEADWIVAREIVRKEILRGHKVGREGVLLKRIRYGPKCTRCRDYLTGGGVTDSRCPECRGTGFKVGYHPPAHLTCWDVPGEPVAEQRNGAQPPGQSREAAIKARALGFPDLDLEDVWVDGHSDQRWYVELVEQTCVLRGVPLIVDVTMRLAPYTDVIYRVPVNAWSARDPRDGMPLAGTGCVTVTHDYGGLDALAYCLADGCGVEGAYVYAFTAADYLAGARSLADVVAATTTTTNGRWTYALQLNPGDYVLLYEKPGEYGPDILDVTVTPPEASSSSARSSQSSFGPL